VSVLLGGLRPADVQSGRRRKERYLGHHPHRGDPDHPVNRGTLCPKGAGLLDFIHSPNRLKFPEIREPGTNEWKRVSWDEAMTRLAGLMKADRDANFIPTNAEGQLVNRWTSTGMLCASASSNETGYITHKAMRSMGMLVFDNQARV